MTIFLDFDGTVVEHEYPKMGRFVPHALRVIRRLQDAGHRIILNTMRVEFKNDSLQDAFNYLWLSNEVDEKAIDYTREKIHPHPWDLTPEAKEIYIDDIAIGIPLIPAVMTNGDMVNWLQVEQDLQAVGILPVAPE